MDERSTIYEMGQCFLYDRDWLKKGVYGREAYFIQQDSVFWHADLWKAAGGIDSRFKRAGDYSLWINFSRHAPLNSVKAYISCFRKVQGQLSQDVASYRKERDLISAASNLGFFVRNTIKIFFWFADHVYLPFLQKRLYRIIFRKQKLLLIDVVHGKNPVLKTVSYYVAP
jgi:hypothetical protein